MDKIAELYLHLDKCEGDEKEELGKLIKVCGTTGAEVVARLHDRIEHLTRRGM